MKLVLEIKVRLNLVGTVSDALKCTNGQIISIIVVKPVLSVHSKED